MPQFQAAGFSTGQFGEPQRTSTVLNGVQYNVAIFRTAVTPARIGDLTLGPAECQLTVLIPQANQRSRDIFDQFFGRVPMQARPTVLQTEAHPIRVLPLPTENVPETFNAQSALTAWPYRLAPPIFWQAIRSLCACRSTDAASLML